MIIQTKDFSLEAGLTHGLVGPNGVGKTTLLRQIAGQVPSADLTVFGQAPYDNPAVMDRTVLMGIDSPLIEGWNVTKLFRLGASRWSTWNQDRAQELQERFGLPESNYSALSRGQKSAMGIVFAVASGCELMLLDEPYLGLDMDRQEAFKETLREEQGRTIVVSTHHLDELAGLLDAVLVLPSNLQANVGEMVEEIVELTGTPANLDRALSRLGLTPLKRTSAALGDKAIIDARGLGDAPYDAAQECNLRVATVPLESAVRALTGGAR